MNVFIYHKDTKDLAGEIKEVTHVSIVDKFFVAKNEDSGFIGNYSLEQFTFKVDNNDA